MIENGGSAPGTSAQIDGSTPSMIDVGLGAACTSDGTLRCSPAGAGARQVCMGGVWTVAQGCASGQVCTGEAGSSNCQTVADVCRGSAGAAVCDGQGNLIQCNPDGTVGSQQACGSARLCQVGLAAQRCAICVPRTEYRCIANLLEVCAADGQSFMLHETCQTEALCNKVAGTCTSSKCAPDKFACDGDTLTKCNSDGSAFASQVPCMAGSCDATGGDCNMCEPGRKICQNDMVATCNAAGQGYATAACPNGSRCVGAGQCAACVNDTDCSAMTQGCKVGMCSATNTCVAQNANNGLACTATGGKAGTCSAGQCKCTPQCSGKACGDDGCGGQCPSSCSLLQSCVNSQCADCTTDLLCPGSTDGCQTGYCNAGKCATRNATSTTRCTTGGVSGMCSAGRCVACTPSCGTSCGGSDGCGGTCRCSGANQECMSGQCLPRLYGRCQTVALVSSECGDTGAVGRSCFGLTPSNLFCIARQTSSTPCPSGTALYGQQCVVACNPGPLGGCPQPFSTCTSLGGTANIAGICVL